MINNQKRNLTDRQNRVGWFRQRNSNSNGYVGTCNQEYESFVKLDMHISCSCIFGLIWTAFFYKNKGFSSFKHTVIKILWPYLVFSIFATITDALLTYENSGSITSARKMILIDGYKTIVLYGIHALWYLGSYVIAVWIYLKIKGLLIRRRIVLEVIFIFGGNII